MLSRQFVRENPEEVRRALETKGLLTPAYVYDEIGAYTEMVSEKAGLTPAAVDELIELLFERIDVVPLPVVLESLHGSCGTPTPTTRSTWRPR